MILKLDMMINKPVDINTSSYYNEYDINDLDNFWSNLVFDNTNITGKKLYIMNKNISQSKLRDSGFTITRSSAKADLIVINDIRELSNEYYRRGNNAKYHFYSSDGADDTLIELTNILNSSSFLTSKFIYLKDLYKYLYKYDGNLELFNNINDLFNSKDSDNAKMAMEFMSNANWSGNEIYLQELFHLHYSHRIRGTHYKNSISFRGFLESLDFNYDSIYFTEASDYRKLCKNEDQHAWVFDKYKEEFKQQLDELVKSYKIKITSLTYEIDKSVLTDN